MKLKDVFVLLSLFSFISDFEPHKKDKSPNTKTIAAKPPI
jgi:hypothetical protein